MYCMKCGAQNADGSKFCIGCGAPMQPIAPAEPVAPADPYVAQPAVPADPYVVQPAAPADPYAAQPAAPADPYVAQPATPVEPYAAQPYAQQPYVQQPIAQPYQQAPVAQPYGQTVAPGKPKKKKLWLIPVIAIPVLLLIAGGVVAALLVPGIIREKQRQEFIAEQTNMAEVQYAEGDYADAIATYGAVLDVDPENQDAIIGMTDIYLAWADSFGTNYDAAISMLEKADSRAKATKIETKITEIKTAKAEAEAEAARIAAEEAAAEQARLEQEAAEEAERLAQEARDNAGITLKNYLEDTLYYSKGRVYDGSYSLWYMMNAEGNVMSSFVPAVGIVCYDIYDLDNDGVDEMVVYYTEGRVVDWGSLSVETQDMYMAVYEVDGYDVYCADDIPLLSEVFGGADYEVDRIYRIIIDGQYYMGADVNYVFGMLSDGETKGLGVYYYDGYSIEKVFAGSTSGSDFRDDETFTDAADALRHYGFVNVPDMIDDGTFSHLALSFYSDDYGYTYDGDTSYLFTAAGANEYLWDYDLQNEAVSNFFSFEDAYYLGTVEMSLKTY